ncbi:hypothetical protein PsYK624_063170 [Phanerochaete sordida]|uniref:Uncharacterized protein n=1 Tax=Phanerochaete sordida TaxID=48140 RepID=A0A9P3LC66_9APHY|nr:hypothetical protein PsYK624_063170 [Phanerochaete sordida]
MRPLPNSRIPTAPIFEYPAAFYAALLGGEIYFTKPGSKLEPPKPEECTTARDLGLRVNGSCVIRGPHVVHGYDDTIHGTVVNFQTLDGYDIVTVKVPTRSAQREKGPATELVERRFLLQWDEVGTEDVEMKIMSPNLMFNMLFDRVRLVPLVTRLIHRKDRTFIDRIVWFPAIFDTTAEDRAGDPHLGLSFVHITPERCPGRAPPHELLFATSVAWAHRAAVRAYAAAQGQLVAVDAFATYFFARPPLAMVADVLGSPLNLPLEPPAAGAAQMQIEPHRRLGRALERVRGGDIDALDEVFAASFVFDCPCMPSMPAHLQRHCVYHS